MSVATSTEKKAEVLIFECTIKGDSGYRKEIAPNVMSNKEEDKRCYPGTVYIPTVGYKWNENGKQVPIRYVSGIDENVITELSKQGINTEVAPNGMYITSSEKIRIDNGILVLKNEGDVGKFTYMRDIFLNENATNRPETDKTKKYFRVIEPLKEEEDFTERFLIHDEATRYVASLVQKSVGGEYKFSTQKIDSLLSLFNEYGGETPHQKITALRMLAENDSIAFLKKVKSLDDSVVTLIVHAEELSVITIGKKNAEFVDNQKILANFEGENLSKDKKVKQLAELLKTPEYASVYQELKAAVDLKEKQSIQN